MKALIYSRNRAAQLDLLLRSIQTYATWIEPAVLYRCDPSHRQSYRICTREHPEAEFVQQVDFEKQTRMFLSNHEEFIWLVDDGVFFRDAIAPTGLPWTTRQSGGHLWRNHKPDTEQGFPLAVCDTAFRSDTILPLLDFRFRNPNVLERGMHERRDMFSPDMIYGDSAPSFCTIEHNAVSPDSWSPTMGGDVDELRALYTIGRRLKLIDDPHSGPHIQVPLVWR